jgi:hypothetical protein
VVNEYITSSQMLEKVDDNKTYCTRRVLINWIKENSEDEFFNPYLVKLLSLYLQKVEDTKFPIDEKTYLFIDNIAIDVDDFSTILATKQQKGLLSEEEKNNIKDTTIKFLQSTKTNLDALYAQIEKDFLTQFENADSIEKLNEFQKLIETTGFFIEIEKGTLKRNEFIFTPYVAILASLAKYIKSTGDTAFIKPLIDYLDSKFLDDKFINDILIDTLEKINFDTIFSIQDFRSLYIRTKDDFEKESAKLSGELNKITEQIKKKTPNAKTFEEALQNTSEDEKKSYFDLEKQRRKIGIFIKNYEPLKKLKETVLQKLSK